MGYLKECDGPERSPFCGFVVTDNCESFNSCFNEHILESFTPLIW